MPLFVCANATSGNPPGKTVAAETQPVAMPLQHFHKYCGATRLAMCSRSLHASKHFLWGARQQTSKIVCLASRLFVVAAKGRSGLNLPFTSIGVRALSCLFLMLLAYGFENLL
jgi:hypothetical protein